MNKTRNIYDEVPYISQTVPDTAPDHLSLCSVWHGGPRPPATGFRALEIGCSNGANLLPLAYYHPESTFVGIDASTVLIEAAGRGAEAIELSNISFELMDIADLDSVASEPFDYIIAHGVYSWVNDRLREALLAYVGRGLSPNGIAYISYNAQPGWTFRGLVRDVLRRHPSVSAAAPSDQAMCAKAVAGRLLTDLPSGDHPYLSLLEHELTRVTEEAQYYVQHEYLSEDNGGFWLGDVVRRAATHGLTYVTDAQFCRPEGQASPELIDAIAERSLSGVAREETIDLLCHRQFRESIFARSETATTAVDHRMLIDELYAATHFTFPADAVVLDGGVRQVMVGMRGVEVVLDVSVTKAAVVLLSTIWPRGMTVSELLAQVRHLLSENGLTIPENAAEILKIELIDLFEAGQVQLRQNEPLGYLYEVPTADSVTLTSLAAYEASVRTMLTGPHHQSLTFEPHVFQKIGKLDGASPLADLFPDDVAAAYVLETLVKWGLVL